MKMFNAEKDFKQNDSFLNLGHFFWLVLNKLHHEKNLLLAFLLPLYPDIIFLKLFYLLTITVQGYQISKCLLPFLSFHVLEKKVTKNSCQKRLKQNKSCSCSNFSRFNNHHEYRGQANTKMIFRLDIKF